MREAQNIIKQTATVNTSEITSKALESRGFKEENDKILKGKKGKKICSTISISVYVYVC